MSQTAEILFTEPGPQIKSENQLVTHNVFLIYQNATEEMIYNQMGHDQDLLSFTH